MRYLPALLLSLAFVPAHALAQAEAPRSNRPPALMPLEDIDPQITIVQRNGETIEEYRMNGQLYKIQVIPRRGEPYILVDHRGDGNFLPCGGPGTPCLSVPQWVVGTF